MLTCTAQRCSPRGSCLGSRPPQGSFLACLALALPQQRSALTWLGLKFSASCSARPHGFWLGSALHLLWFCLESLDFCVTVVTIQFVG